MTGFSKGWVRHLMISRVRAEAHLLSNPLFLSVSTKSMGQEYYETANMQAQNSFTWALWTCGHTLPSIHPGALEFLKKINCSLKSQKAFLLWLHRLLYFSWIGSEKSWSFTFPHREAGAGLENATAAAPSSTDTEVGDSKRQNPPTFFFQLG